MLVAPIPSTLRDIASLLRRVVLIGEPPLRLRLDFQGVSLRPVHGADNVVVGLLGLVSTTLFAEHADDSIDQHIGWDRLLHVLTFAARAVDVVVPTVDHERDVSLVQPVADL